MALTAKLSFEKSKRVYNILDCDYEFFVSTKGGKDGKTEAYWPNANARGGYITFTIPILTGWYLLGESDFFEWLIKGTDKSGQFVFEIMVGGEKKKKVVKFQEAKCIEFQEKFESQKEEQMTMTIKFSAKHIQFGEEKADFFLSIVKEDEKEKLKESAKAMK